MCEGRMVENSQYSPNACHLDLYQAFVSFNFNDDIVMLCGIFVPTVVPMI